MIAANTQHHPITQEYYNKLKSDFPLLYVDTVNDLPVDDGFAITEAKDYNERGVIVHTCFITDRQCYSCSANIMHGYEFIKEDYLDYEDSRGNKAYTL